MSRFVGFNIVHVVLPIPKKMQHIQILLITYVHLTTKICINKYMQYKVYKKPHKYIKICIYFIAPPSSPETIQLSLWLQTMDLIAWSCACMCFKIHLWFVFLTTDDYNNNVKTIIKVVYLKNHFKIKRLSIPKSKFPSLWTSNKSPACWSPLFLKIKQWCSITSQIQSSGTFKKLKMHN